MLIWPYCKIISIKCWYLKTSKFRSSGKEGGSLVLTVTWWSITQMDFLLLAVKMKGDFHVFYSIVSFFPFFSLMEYCYCMLVGFIITNILCKCIEGKYHYVEAASILRWRACLMYLASNYSQIKNKSMWV